MILGLARSRAARRWGFLAYALTLATLTHWPRLSIESPGGVRLDVFIHAAVFGAWSVLLTMCGFFGEPFSRRNLEASFVVAMLYSLVDELTQGIPGVGRTVDPADLVANGTGILLAMGFLWLVALLQSRRAAAL